MTEHEEDLLALLIVEKKPFADAYNLCRVLARRFDIIGCSEIIKRIQRMSYITITYPKSPTLEFFHLTEDGRKILEQERSLLGNRLMESFPEQTEFIENLVGLK